MRIPSARAGLAALALGLGLVGTGVAAEPVKPAASSDEPAVHRMVIYNGPIRTVHYFARGISRGDQVTLTNLERAENQLAVDDQVQALQRQYVADERALEAQRRQALQIAYAPSPGAAAGIPVPSYSVLGPNFYPTNLTTLMYLPNGMLAGGGASLNYPAGFPGGWGFGGLVGGGGVPAVGYGAEALLPVPSPGPIKTELARTLAVQAMPESATLAAHTYDVALQRASQSDALRAGLDIKRREGTFAGFETTPPAEHPASGHVVVTMKNGDKIEGTLVREDNDRLVVSAGAQEVEIRKSETASISKGPAGKSGKSDRGDKMEHINP